MYIPAHFAEDDVAILHGAIRAFGLATLVTHTGDGLIASHLPLLLDPDRGPYGTLIGHVARANPQAKPSIGEALAIFQGPEGYVSPSLYATKRETGKVVPTWNYAAVHAYGTPRFIEDKASLLDIVTRLTHHHEAKRSLPWAVTDAPEEFVQGMLNAIIGFELPIVRLEGKWKMSQNRPAAEHTGIVDGLRAGGQAALADMVAEVAARATAKA